ncbi:hypothetical protein AAC387_Pa07g3849 [Persea americana]
MADPVIVSSGHSFDAPPAEACKTLVFSPQHLGGSRPNLSSLIPNLSLKSAILHWCNYLAMVRLAQFGFSLALLLIFTDLPSSSSSDAPAPSPNSGGDSSLPDTPSPSLPIASFPSPSSESPSRSLRRMRLLRLPKYLLAEAVEECEEAVSLDLAYRRRR